MSTVPYGLKDPDILEGIVWTKVVLVYFVDLLINQTSIQKLEINV